jgi:hypothetical protein
MLWSPTIRAALIAGTPWLDLFCPGCGTSRAIDLRNVDRHPLASVATIVLASAAHGARKSAPMLRILGLQPCRLRQRQRRRPLQNCVGQACWNVPPSFFVGQ